MPNQHQATPIPRMTPTVLGRRDIVTALISAPFDAWFDQWMLQADAATDPADVDYFDDAVRMFIPAAVGLAAAALRAHLDAHQTGYAAAGVTLFVEPLPEQHDGIICTFGLIETMHEDILDEDDDEFPRFRETVEHYALIVPAYRDGEDSFSADAFAPGDPFFSAVDQNPVIGAATLADVKAHPEVYALVDVQVATLYAQVALLARDDDEASASDVALTA